jgi:hypothetical protein
MGKVIQVFFNGVGLAANVVVFFVATAYLCIFHNKEIKEWIEGQW